MAPPAHERRRQPEGRRTQENRAAPEAARAKVEPERIIVALALLDESLLEQATTRLGPDHFRHPLYRRMYEELMHLYTEGGRGPEVGWVDLFPEDLLGPLQELLAPEVAESLSPAGEYFEQSVRRILLRPIDERLAEISRQLQSATPAEEAALQEERERLRREMQEQNLTGSRKHGMLRQLNLGIEER